MPDASCRLFDSADHRESGSTHFFPRAQGVVTSAKIEQRIQCLSVETLCSVEKRGKLIVDTQRALFYWFNCDFYFSFLVTIVLLKKG